MTLFSWNLTQKERRAQHQFVIIYTVKKVQQNSTLVILFRKGKLTQVFAKTASKIRKSRKSNYLSKCFSISGESVWQVNTWCPMSLCLQSQAPPGDFLLSASAQTWLQLSSQCWGSRESSETTEERLLCISDRRIIQKLI